MRWLALAATLVLAAPARADDAVPEPAPPPPRPTPFDRGKFGLSLGAGRQNELDASYIFVAGGLGYYVLDGVQIGLAGEHFFGNGPTISLVTPSLRYVAQPLVGKFPLIPYIGAFYDHYFIGGLPDQDGVGGRAGGSTSPVRWCSGSASPWSARCRPARRTAPRCSPTSRSACRSSTGPQRF